MWLYCVCVVLCVCVVCCWCRHVVVVVVLVLVSLFFFPLSRSIFALFFPLGGSSRGVVVADRGPRPQLHEKTSQEGKKTRTWGGRGEKARNFLPSPLWAPTSGLHPTQHTTQHTHTTHPHHTHTTRTQKDMAQVELGLSRNRTLA